VRQVVDDYRRWIRDVLRGLLVADGRRDADQTADILLVIRDGVVVGADLGDPKALRTVIRDAVTRVLDARG
jgi:hypothetical protein